MTKLRESLLITATEPIVEWIRRELVEKRRAAGVGVAGSQEHLTVSTSVADQIRELAELRDSGAITEEEFEAKTWWRRIFGDP